MSRSDAEETEQCRALTSDGDRCQHAATDGAFCHQHDESDPTVDEDGETEGAADGEDGGESGATDDGDPSAGGSADDSSSVDGAGSLLDVRRTATAVTEEVIERPLDGVVEMTRRDGEWLVTVEVVERSAVPDTQDILGRYEITLSGPETVTGYRRVSRYRRIDTDGNDHLE